MIDAARVRGLKRDYTLANHAAVSEPELRQLVSNLVTEEILFREAVARGFEQGDRAIGWRLVQKMRYLGEDHGEDMPTLYKRGLEMGLHRSDPVVRRILIEKIRLIIGHAGPKPTEDELKAWYEANKQQYGQSTRVTFRHVFFDRGRRGNDDARKAAEQAAADAAGKGVDRAWELGGDPFVMGTELASQGKDDLTKLFGPQFAGEVLALPQDAWSKPIESTYGWHLVFVEQRFEPRIPDLAEVRSRAEKSLEVERREARVAKFLDDARRKYTVLVDEAAIREHGNG